MSPLVVMSRCPLSWSKNWKGIQLGVLKDGGPLVLMLFWILEQIGLEVEITLNEFAQFFPVLVAHMHKFHTAAVRPDVPDHGCKINLAQAGANLKFDRIANAQFPRRFQIGATQADGLHSRQARL